VRVRGQITRAGAENRPAQKARSAAFIRDSLPRYLAALYIEDRFGKDALRDVYTRWRWSYTSIAQSGRDAELGLQTITLPNYAAAVFAKGPLVLRMLAERMGRDKLIETVKTTHRRINQDRHPGRFSRGAREGQPRCGQDFSAVGRFDHRAGHHHRRAAARQ